MKKKIKPIDNDALDKPLFADLHVHIKCNCTYLLHTSEQF